MDIIFAQNITKCFKQADTYSEVLDDITVRFEKGVSYAIVGASGSGKSTLMHILGGLDAPTEGQVFFDTVDRYAIKSRKKNSVFQRSIGFMFQFHYLIQELTVLENVMVPGIIQGKSWRECKKKAEELLSMVGLEAKLGAYSYTLSGGELQRVSFVRALFNEPSFLLADEPTGSLDAVHARQMVDLMLTHQRERGMGLIVCSHDREVYERMDVCFILRNGKLGNE